MNIEVKAPKNNPLQKYPSYPEQEQRMPGSEQQMDPKPDHGETSYQGTGKLAGRKALITGGDSGIGKAVAIALCPPAGKGARRKADRRHQGGNARYGLFHLDLPGTA